MPIKMNEKELVINVNKYHKHNDIHQEDHDTSNLVSRLFVAEKNISTFAWLIDQGTIELSPPKP
jgi:hypothetical protein